MRILLIGKNGQVGWELQRSLAPLCEVLCVDYPEIDLSELSALPSLIRNNRPQVIVNAAAYTSVDQAEDDRDMALTINAAAPGVLADEARKLGAALLHYSTDYVFNGQTSRPYLETDHPDPINIYGQSKLAGEQAIQQVGGAFIILRTSWVYSLRRSDFVNKVLEWSRKQRILKVVTDQVGSPTWCRMLAEATALLLGMAGKDPAGWLQERRGIYHLAGEGSASRLEWARAILALDPHPKEQILEVLQPALSSEFPTPASRPAYSALNCDRFSAVFGLRLPAWEEALRMAMELLN